MNYRATMPKLKRYLESNKTEFGNEIQLVDYALLDRENVTMGGSASIGGYQIKKISKVYKFIK